MDARAAVAGLLILALAALLWWLPEIGVADSVEGAEALIRSWGAWGVAASLGLMVLHSFLPFPAEIIALANGMVYGPLWGALITWTGAMLGASVAFALGRALGRAFVTRRLSPAQQQQLGAWAREQGGVAILAARLIPLIAFNLINYAAALAPISWWTFLWATGVGILPLTVLLAVLGENVLEMSRWAWLVLAALALLAWIPLRRWRRSQRSASRP